MNRRMSLRQVVLLAMAIVLLTVLALILFASRQPPAPLVPADATATPVKDVSPIVTESTLTAGVTVGYAPLLTPFSAVTPTVAVTATLAPLPVMPTLAPAMPPTPLPTLALTATSASAIPPATPVAKPGTLADRFGVIVTGVSGQPKNDEVINHIVSSLGARWWYQYDQSVPDSRSAAVQQVRLLRFAGKPQTGPNLAASLAVIAAVPHPAGGGYWMIGNEPNVSGQDDLDPDVYAVGLHDLVAAIRAVEPQATIIGPNVLNWDFTCIACPGFESGQSWVTRMRAAYHKRYNAEPPFDVWSLHTYNLDWERLPMLDPEGDQEQIQNMRADLDAIPALRNKPMWLTEFGVVWGYDGLEWRQIDGAWRAMTKGTYRADLIAAYFKTTLDWLEANSTKLHLDRWFVYTSYGLAEPFTGTYTGLSLFAAPPRPGAALTQFGQTYSAYIRRAAQVRP